MRSTSYKAAITSVFLVLSLLGIAGVLSVTHSSTKAIFLKLSSEIIRNLKVMSVQRAADSANAIENYLRINAQIAAHTDGILAAQELLLPVFWQQIIHTPAVRNVYIADSAGNLVQSDQDPSPVTRVVDQSVVPLSQKMVYRDPDFQLIARVTKPIDYDPRSRAWFKNSVAGKVLWSPVYRFAFSVGQDSTRALGITASLAVNDAQGRIRYVVAADLTLQGMSSFLSEQLIAEAVAIFVVDGQDRLVAYPHQLGLDHDYSSEDAVLPKVQELPQQWIQDAYANYKKSGLETVDGALVTQTDGKTYLTTATDFEPGINVDLRLVMIAPKSYLIDSADTIMRESLVVSLIILLISLVAIYLIAAYLSEPVRQLAANGRRIEEFRFGEVVSLTSHWRDVESLNKSLSHIGTQLRTLEKYAPAEMVARLRRKGGEPEVSTEVQELDLLVSAIGDSVRMFRTLTPDQLNECLPGHFEALAGIIHDQRGTIDRFTGDGILAFWGAPATITNGAHRACCSALLSVQVNRDVAHLHPEVDGTPIAANFAIHHDMAVVGNFGSSQRLSYTAIGELLFIGEALLALNLRYGTRIIISDATYRRIAEDFQCRPLDRVQPLGAGPNMTIYELVATGSTQLTLAHRRFIDGYTLAFEAYLRQAWQEALDQLASVPASYRQDPSLRLLSSRCRGLLDGSLDAPPATTEWDGVLPVRTVG